MKVSSVVLDLLTGAAALSALVLTGAYGWERWAADDTDAVSRSISDWERYSTQGKATGPTDAAVVLVYFGDYQCPACRSLEPHLRAVSASFPGQIRTVFRNWPLDRHSLAYPAARAAECAHDQGAFFEMHGLLYENSSWIEGGEDAIISLAGQVPGLDLETFGRCARASQPVPTIEADIAAAKELGGTGTPTLLVNDQLILARWDSASLRQFVSEMIDE